jgi:succinoglycan biosynthesis transport protein ExoP
LADNFLQLYMQSVQQQSFPVTEARLITQASPPLMKSWPKALIVLAIAVFLGAVLAVAVGLLRDLIDRVFRTAGQIENRLQINCLALLPIVRASIGKATRPEIVSISGEKIITPGRGLFWQVVDAPFSRFTEAVRSIKVAVELLGQTRPNKVIAITSSLPHEGKSTVASALGLLIANSGAKTLLVDCDLRNPSMTRSMAPKAETGIIEAISGQATLEDLLWREPETGLFVLPAALKARIANTSDILASRATKKLFEQLREKFDYVIVDLPPLAPIIDVRTTGNLVDSYVFVVEWGATKIDVVERALKEMPEVYDNLLGVVLNKADLSVLSRYENYRGSYYNNRYYARYGYGD